MDGLTQLFSSGMAGAAPGTGFAAPGGLHDSCVGGLAVAAKVGGGKSWREQDVPGERNPLLASAQRRRGCSTGPVSLLGGAREGKSCWLMWVRSYRNGGEPSCPFQVRKGRESCPPKHVNGVNGAVGNSGSDGPPGRDGAVCGQARCSERMMPCAPCPCSCLQQHRYCTKVYFLYILLLYLQAVTFSRIKALKLVLGAAPAALPRSGNRGLHQRSARPDVSLRFARRSPAPHGAAGAAARALSGLGRARPGRGAPGGCHQPQPQRPLPSACVRETPVLGWEDEAVPVPLPQPRGQWAPGTGAVALGWGRGWLPGGPVPPLSLAPGWGSRAQALQGRVRTCWEQPRRNVLPGEHQHRLQSLHGKVWGVMRPRRRLLLCQHRIFSCGSCSTNPHATPVEPAALDWFEVPEMALNLL